LYMVLLLMFDYRPSILMWVIKQWLPLALALFISCKVLIEANSGVAPKFISNVHLLMHSPPFKWNNISCYIFTMPRLHDVGDHLFRFIFCSTAVRDFVVLCLKAHGCQSPVEDPKCLALAPVVGMCFYLSWWSVLTQLYPFFSIYVFLHFRSDRTIAFL
jgi:hypothetical protein